MRFQKAIKLINSKRLTHAIELPNKTICQYLSNAVTHFDRFYPIHN